jgi:hypothetical protein
MSESNLNISYDTAIFAAVALALAANEYGTPSISVTDNHCVIIRFENTDQFLAMDNVTDHWMEREHSSDFFFDKLAWSMRCLLNCYGLLSGMKLLDEMSDPTILEAALRVPRESYYGGILRGLMQSYFDVVDFYAELRDK